MTSEIGTTDNFTDAQGRRFIAGCEVPEAVWERFNQQWQSFADVVIHRNALNAVVEAAFEEWEAAKDRAMARDGAVPFARSRHYTARAKLAVALNALARARSEPGQPQDREWVEAPDGSLHGGVGEPDSSGRANPARYCWVLYKDLLHNAEDAVSEALASVLTDAEMTQFATDESIPEDVQVGVVFWL